MAGWASGEGLIMRDPFEVAEVAYVHGYLHMLALHNVRMAASAVEPEVPFHLHEVWLMVKGYTSFSE